MGLHLRLLPGAKARLTRRGMRCVLGPRAAGLHPGTGRSGASTGAAPFTWYRPLRRRRQ
jgi:hypothetical protein